MHKKTKIIFGVVVAVMLILALKIAIFEFFKTCGNCAKPQTQEASQQGVTWADFRNYTLIYSTSNGSLPPPFHRQNILTVSKDSQGKITASYETRDYTKSLEKKTITVSSEQFDSLMKAALQVGTGTPDSLRGCTGGHSKSLRVLKGEEALVNASLYTCGGESTNQSLEKFSAEIDDLFASNSFSFLPQDIFTSFLTPHPPVSTSTSAGDGSSSGVQAVPDGQLPPPLMVNVGDAPPPLDYAGFTTTKPVDIWANKTHDSVTVPYASKPWLTWKSDTTTYPDMTCKAAMSFVSVAITDYPHCLDSAGNRSGNCDTWHGGSLPASGQVQVGPIVIPGQTFTISCSTQAGAKEFGARVAIDVAQDTKPLKVDFSVNGKSYDATPKDNSGSAYLNFPWKTSLDVVWNSNDPDAQCYAQVRTGSASLWNTVIPASGEKIIDLSTTDVIGPYYVHLTCKARGEAVDETINVSEPKPATVYTMDLKGNGQNGPLTVAPGTNVLLSWTSNYSDNSVRCTASGDWSGSKHLPNGQEFTGPLSTNKSYTLSCAAVDPMDRNYVQSSDKTVTVYVSDTARTSTPSPSPSPSPAPTPATPPTPTIPPAGFEDQVFTSLEKNPFSDTDLNDICGKAAADLYKRAIVGGFSDGTFKNGDSVNRAQAAKFLLLAASINANSSDASNFKDVLKDQWYTKYVLQAAQLGIIGGYNDRTFRPEKPVNTAEFLKMLTLTFKLETDLPEHFSDVKSSDWFSKYAGIAEKYDLFPQDVQSCAGIDANATTQNMLNPGKKLTRADVSVAIYQYLTNR